jgi:hypothetical protein
MHDIVRPLGSLLAYACSASAMSVERGERLLIDGGVGSKDCFAWHLMGKCEQRQRVTLTRNPGAANPGSSSFVIFVHGLKPLNLSSTTAGAMFEAYI